MKREDLKIVFLVIVLFSSVISFIMWFDIVYNYPVSKKIIDKKELVAPRMHGSETIFVLIAEDYTYIKVDLPSYYKCKLGETITADKGNWKK